MKIAKWIAFAISVLSGMATIAMYIFPWVIGRFFHLKTGASGVVGIIGGADGPTAVFVAKETYREFIVPIAFVLSVSLWLFFRYKSKKI